MANPKNSLALGFITLVWSTLLILWIWTYFSKVSNQFEDFKLKNLEEITHGSP
jgi:hypothetical protein